MSETNNSNSFGKLRKALLTLDEELNDYYYDFSIKKRIRFLNHLIELKKVSEDEIESMNELINELSSKLRSKEKIIKYFEKKVKS